MTLCGRDADVAAAAARAVADRVPGADVVGVACDVTDPTGLDALAAAAARRGTVHHWINAAGAVTQNKLLSEVEVDDLLAAAGANIIGPLLGCRAALGLMLAQPPPHGPFGYHVWNFGFSAWGASLSKSAATHKATKTGVSQLTRSLNEELAAAGEDAVAVHQLSPGLVLTDLLLKGSSPVGRRFFNVLAEEPEAVAADLAPRILAADGTTDAVEFLTLADAVRRVATGVPQIVGGGRFFDERGDRVSEPGVRYTELGARVLW